MFLLLRLYNISFYIVLFINCLTHYPCIIETIHSYTLRQYYHKLFKFCILSPDNFDTNNNLKNIIIEKKYSIVNICNLYLFLI